MNYKSLILAALLAPSFCLAESKEDKKQQISIEMYTLMMKMIAIDHLKITNLWKEHLTFPDKEFAENERKDAIQRFEEALRLIAKMEELQ